MKTNDAENEALSRILRTWRTDAPLPPHFRDDVWRRIDRAEAKSDFGLWTRLSVWIEGVLPRPEIAFCYVTSLLLVGLTGGMWAARQENDRMNADLGSRYVQSVDPYQTLDSNR